MTTPLTTLCPVVVSEIVLPSNITAIETQADLYCYGVRYLSYLQVADKAEAIQEAGGRKAFLLKSKRLLCYYLIFPLVTVEEWTK